MSDLERIAVALERIALALEREAEASRSVIASLPPEGLSKEDVARYLGIDVAGVEHLIRTRKLASVKTGAQRGRIVPVEALRDPLREYRAEALNGEH
jgi:hypothetical protein